LGGVLYNKAAYSGAFGLGSSILSVGFIMWILLIEKKAAAHYDFTLVSGAVNPRYHSTENCHTESNGEANKEGTLLPKKEEK
jgi:hypothetical protein